MIFSMEILAMMTMIIKDLSQKKDIVIQYTQMKTVNISIMKEKKKILKKEILIKIILVKIVEDQNIIIRLNILDILHIKDQN